MSGIHLILTADYETWGNGSGCVENCVLDPTDQMLEIAGKFKAPITFFFDVCEYWAFKEIEDAGKFDNNYKPATGMRDQLIKAVQQGHDVQLHFHPQWLNYKFISNQSWELDYRYWCLPEVDNYHTNNWSIDKLVEKGIATLTEIFKPLKADYRVNVFRAGAWCIQPEEAVIKTLEKYNIEIDSTVTPGRKYDDGITKYDFTKATFKKSSWKIGNQVVVQGTKKITEIPIFTTNISLFNRLKFQSIRLSSGIQRLPKKCYCKVDTAGEKQFFFDKLNKLLFQSSRMLNYSDAVTFEEMRMILNKAIEKFGNEKEWQPIVAISHPKTFGNPSEFEKFLSWASGHEKVRFGTYHDLNK